MRIMGNVDDGFRQFWCIHFGNPDVEKPSLSTLSALSVHDRSWQFWGFHFGNLSFEKPNLQRASKRASFWFSEKQLLAATWQPLAQAATWQPLGRHLLQPLGASVCEWMQVAAWASGCKWLQLAATDCSHLQRRGIFKKNDVVDFTFCSRLSVVDC